MAADLLQRLLIPLAAGTALAAVLALLRPLTRRRFSVGWHYYMWLAPLAVMLIPVSIPLPRRILPVSYGAQAVLRLSLSAPAADRGETPLYAVPSRVDWTEWAARIWLLAAAALLGFKLIRYFWWRRSLMKGSRPVPCPRLGLHTRRRVAVRKGAGVVGSPLLLGLIRPVLLLPETPLTDAQLDHVLAHETAHLHRGDLWIKWFVMILRCLYWFNPAVWLIGLQMERDCEMACDRAAVRGMKQEQIKAYLDTLLVLAAGRSLPPAAALGDSGSFLKKRFRMAMENKKTSRRAGWISALLAAVLILSFFTVSGVLAGDSLPPEKNELPAESGFAAPERTSPTEQTVDLPAQTEEILFLMPCPDSERISALFGYRWGHMHTGVDFFAPVGSSVLAAADGVVTVAVSDRPEEGYGNYLVVDHGTDGEGRRVTTLYAHLDSLAAVPGDRVAAGQPLGASGKTGNATGPHLHFEIRLEGVPVDPMEYYIAAE